MKKALFIIIAALITASVILISGCGSEKATVEIGPDGYGKTTLANGVTVLINHDESTSLSAVSILIGGGVLSETSGNNGITNLMARMLFKGNQRMSASQIIDSLDFLGAGFSIDCSRENCEVAFTCLTKYFDPVMDIVSQCLLNPTFPEDELVKLKHEVEGDIKAANDNQSRASSNLFWKTIYGNKGYGLPIDGTLESISGIGVDDIKAHYLKYVGGKNIIFAAASDLPSDRLIASIEAGLGGLKSEAEEISAFTPDYQSEKIGFISFERNQSFLYMGFPMTHLKTEDVPCLIMLNEIMGNNVGSRLWYLRQDEKLAYAVYSQYGLNKFGSVFRAAIGTDTSKVKQATESLSREFRKLLEKGITEQELADARINMKNNMIYFIDRKTTRAANMAYYEFAGYSHRFPLEMLAMVDRITLEDVNRFINKNFSEDNKYLSIVGKS